MSAWSSVYEKRILPTKPFQASQSGHQLSVYETKILVQNCLQNEYALGTSFLDSTCSTFPRTLILQFAFALAWWQDEKVIKFTRREIFIHDSHELLYLVHSWTTQTTGCRRGLGYVSSIGSLRSTHLVWVLCVCESIVFNLLEDPLCFLPAFSLPATIVELCWAQAGEQSHPQYGCCKSEKTTAASKWTPNRPKISINWNFTRTNFKGTNTCKRPLMTSQLHRLWCFLFWQWGH